MNFKELTSKIKEKELKIRKKSFSFERFKKEGRQKKKPLDFDRKIFFFLHSFGEKIGDSRVSKRDF